MAARRNGLRFASLGAAFGLAGALAGCAGADVQIDAPILEAAGINLVSKPPPEPDLEEKPPLVVPPDTQRLPKPGERQVAAAEEQWPEDPDKIAAKKAKKAEKERKRYCREGATGPARAASMNSARPWAANSAARVSLAKRSVKRWALATRSSSRQASRIARLAGGTPGRSASGLWFALLNIN